jgi:hypothetical protein
MATRKKVSSSKTKRTAAKRSPRRTSSISTPWSSDPQPSMAAQWLTVVFTALSIVFAALAFWRYA